MLLSLTSDGKCRLQTESGETITISEPELLSLGQLVLPYLDQLKRKHAGQRIVPIPTAIPSSMILSLDAHHTKVVLRFEESTGFQNAYELPLENVKQLRDGLDKKLSEIEEAKQRRTLS